MCRVENLQLKREISDIKKELKKLNDAKMSADERVVHLLEYAQLTFDLQKVAVLHFNKPDVLSKYADFRDIREVVTPAEWQGFLRQFELTPAMIQFANTLKSDRVASAPPDLREAGVIARMRNDVAAIFPMVDTQYDVSNLIDRWEKHVKPMLQ